MDDFSPHSQGLAASWLLHQKAILPYLKIGDFAGALDPASRVWSSLPKGEGSWNVGRYDNARYGFQKAHDFSASSRSTIMRWTRGKAMIAETMTTKFTLFALLLLVAVGFEAKAASPSAFQKSRPVLKASIAEYFGCSWRPYLEGSEQCGDELIVLEPNSDGAVESVEFTCALRFGRSTMECQKDAVWLLDAFTPSWSARRRWLAKVFRDSLRRGQSLRATTDGKTVLAKFEGPEDAPVTSMVIGITRGDPRNWDLPR